MNLQELQKQIINKQLNNIYIFVGEEIAIQKIYINKMQQISKLELQYVSDLKSIYNKLNNNNIFNTKKLYVVIDDTDYIKQEKLWQELPNKLNGNTIIFKFNTLDKRSKFYKQFNNELVEFNKLSNEVLTQYIKKALPTLSDISCNKLIHICNNNYNQILLEIDKIQMSINYPYETPTNMDADTLFNKLDSQGAFHKEISDITFEFVDKVLTRDILNVYKLRKDLVKINESNIKILSLLYNGFKTMLLIQSCKSGDICKTTGLQYYQVKYNQDKINNYSIGELINILRTIQRIEKSIKIGTIEEPISLDYLLVNIL